MVEGFWRCRGVTGGRLGMALVGLVVLEIVRHQVAVMRHDKQILGILMFGLVGEVEASVTTTLRSITMILLWAMACLASINRGTWLSVRDVQVGMSIFLIASVEQDLDMDAPLLGFHQPERYGIGGEG